MTTGYRFTLLVRVRQSTLVLIAFKCCPNCRRMLYGIMANCHQDSNPINCRMSRSWLADRIAHFESSGIRKVFDKASQLADPINLAIGQPDFPVPEEIKEAAVGAIRSDKNGYSATQGMPILRDKLQSRIEGEFGHGDRSVFVTSGTSGGLALALLALVNPGDEVVVFDLAS
jgi:DNA-binding transcriptional MocR family regulator